MKTVGIIGGVGPESTVYYYQKIIKEYQKRTKSMHYPNINIVSIDMTEMLTYVKNKEYDDLINMLSEKVENLRMASSDFVVIASNTPHVIFERLEKSVSVKLISIVDSACKFIKQKGYKKVLLTGTLFTMQENFYSKYASKHKFELLVPSKDEMLSIQDVIFPELEEGIIILEKKEKYIKIVEQYVREQGIDSVILGCTELPLMISDEDLSIPAINTSEIHVQAIVDEMLNATD